MTRTAYIKLAEECREHSLKQWARKIAGKSAEECKFCVRIGCDRCPLSEDAGCCGHLWAKYIRSFCYETERRVIAQQIFDYIKNRDFEAIADKLVREGLLEK